jgi:hypothetical protein
MISPPDDIVAKESHKPETKPPDILAEEHAQVCFQPVVEAGEWFQNADRHCATKGRRTHP